ncbi:MAG: lamin tail domain-containing protein, partial [Sphingobacterium thalpophilum]
MKKTVIILLLFNCLTGYSQINDDFSDGNFSSNPEWNGSNAGGDFRIINNRLRSESTKTSGNFYLSTSNTYAKNCYWEFWVNLQFSTSGSNYVDIYLVSDKSDLQSTLINGYFVRIGNTEDEISLYRRSGSAGGSTRIIDGINGSVGSTNNTVKVRVSRDNLGLFTLEREVIGTNSQLVNEGTFLDNSHVNTSSFGIFIQQSTASFFQKHFFDDFKVGILKIDTIAPTLSTVIVLNSTTLELQFSEAMDSLSVKDKKNYTIQNFKGIILDINTETNPQKYTIRLSEPLSTGDFILTVINVLDRSGNKIKSNNNHSFNYTKPYDGIFRDIVINELFPDPSPQVGLPMAEFVELLNTSDKTISIKNWKILDLTSTAIIGDFSISPGSNLILCAKTDTLEFQKFGKVIGISPWPSLNNSNDVIKLLNTQNSLIDSVSYSDLWYRNAEKKQGGWSLERIDPRSVCEGPFNWAASIDSIGGTPGKRNSIQLLNYDLLPLKADSVNKTTDTTLIVYLNKHVDKSTILKENFRLSPEAGDIRNIIPDADNKQVKITFTKIFTAGITYALTISGLKDCSGNSIQNQSAGFSFSIPAPVPPPIEKPDTALIYISEIFADPSPEVGLPLVEFVEIHNPGKDPVNLEGWTLSDTQTRSTLKKNLITAGEFLILCPAADTSLYKPFGKTLGLSPWPSLGNASDRLVLKSIKNRTVDSIAYSDTWYNDSKKREGGWSLERIDVLSKCNGIFNWTTSIDTVGGTPGKKNSVNIQNYDLVPFKTDSLILKSDSTLFLFFNKSADISTLRIENFLLSPSAGQIKNITQDSKCRQIIITFSEKFIGGKTYNLKLSGLKDCSGNSIQNQSAG